jgi:hypothetical protein
MEFQARLNELEALAVILMQGLPQNASIHDYQSIMLPVNRAYRAIDSAYRILQKAENNLLTKRSMKSGPA